MSAGASGVNIWELVAKIEANFSQSDKAIDQNERKVDKLIITYRNLDKETQKVSKSHGSFSSVLGGLQSTTSQVGGPLGDILGKVKNLTGAFGEGLEAAGPWGIAVGVAGAVAIGAAAGIVSLTVAVAEQTGKFVDLSQETGFQVETLSALSNALETSGGDIDTATQSLFIFETKMGDAKEKGSELSKVFKTLGIDTHNNELALRQALDALQNMTDAETRATLGKKLFGKSAKDLLAALAEAGSFQAFYNKQIADGTLITTKEAKAGDDLSDSLIIVKREFLAAGRSIASEFEPMVTDALREFSTWLRNNQGEIRETAKELVRLVGDVSSLANLIYQISPLRLEIDVIKKISEVFDFGSSKDEKGVVSSGPGGQSLFDKFRDLMDRGPIKDPSGAFGPATGDPNATQAQRDAAVKKYNDEQKAAATAMATAKKKQDEINKLLAGGGGKKAGGGSGEDPAKIAQQIAKLKLDATITGLKAEQDANKRSLDLRREDFNAYATQYIVIENRRHGAVVAGLNAEKAAAEKLKKGREVALQEIANKRAAENTEHEQNRNKALDERARIVDQINNFLRDQDRSIQSLTNSTDQWDQAYQQMVDTLKEEGVELEKNTRERIEANIARAKELQLVLSVTRARKVSESTRERTVTKASKDRPPWIDLGGGSTVGGEPATTERGRVVTADEAGHREQLEIFRDRMKAIASDLTFIIDDAMRDGFEHGIKHGVIAFGIGILEMAHHAALKALEKAIANALIGGDGGARNSQGGGDWLSKLLGWGISALGGFGGFGGGSVGGIGGGAAGTVGTGGAMGIGGHADGGFMRPFEWSWVGERGPEKVRAGYHGLSVLSNEQSTGGNNTYHISMPINVPNAHAAGTRETQDQLKRTLTRTLKQVTLKG